VGCPARECRGGRRARSCPTGSYGRLVAVPLSGARPAVECVHRSPGLRAGTAAGGVALTVLVAVAATGRLRATKTSPAHHRAVTGTAGGAA
jgi:hypothetical protein